MPLAPGPLRIEFPVEVSPPPTRDFLEEQIAFFSNVAANATVVPISYGSWSAAGAVNAFPPTFNPDFSFATKWGDTNLLPEGTPGGNVTYWFKPLPEDPGNVNPPWDDTAKEQWVSALNLWSAVANITFTEAPDAASADFFLVQSNANPDTSQSFPTLHLRPSAIGASEVSSPSTPTDSDLPDVSIGTDTAPLNGVFEWPDFQGGDSYFALVHELGHLLGLGHTGPYNASENKNDPQAPELQFSPYDMELWSIMSYIKPNETNAVFFDEYPVEGTNWGTTSDGLTRFPTTPMMLDILAAQRLYGRPTHGPLVDGNDVFGFNVHLGDDNVAKSIERYFDFKVNEHPVITIWDGGFNNTLDLSGWSTPSTINLNPGTFSSANGQINNIGIARDTVIETAKGGQGSDTIIGNDFANFLFGNAGDDDLNGGPGNDTLDGGPGNDAVTGGLGADRFVLAAISDGVDSFLDFSRVQHDQIALEHTGFDLGGTGTLAAVGVSLINGATAQSSTPTILYNAGDVSWDPDGTGSDAPALLAHVLTAEAPTVAANPAAPGPTMVSSTSAAHVFPQLFPDDFVIV